MVINKATKAPILVFFVLAYDCRLLDHTRPRWCCQVVEDGGVS